MKLGYTIVYVQDVPATVAFYERAFGLQRRFADESGQYAEMETGETALAFAAESLAQANHVEVRPNRRSEEAAGIELAFTDADPEAALARAVEAGAELVHAVVVKPWGQRVGYVRDLNGVLVEICSPMGG